MKLTDSDQDLYKQLVDALYAMHPRDRFNAHWVMNDHWVRRIDAIRLTGAPPAPPSWAFLPDKVLLGKPVQVREDGGEPHMEAEPQREGVLIEPGQEVVYIQCDDPDCPKHKPGLHHAHLKR